jgi:RES domain-containing protein
MRLWRISNHADLSGTGGLLVDGRWHRRGRPIVYAADHPATALLEALVHLDRAHLPTRYQLMEIIGAPDDLPALTPPAGWADDRTVSQDLGDGWLRAAEAVAVRVPSVLVPEAFNALINPTHPAARDLAIGRIWRAPFDARL